MPRHEPKRKMITFKEFLRTQKKIIIEVPQELLKARNTWTRLDEATRVRVGRYVARRDPPHFQGDQYHGHSDVGGGYEVSWNIPVAGDIPISSPLAYPRTHEQRSLVSSALIPAYLSLSKFMTHNSDGWSSSSKCAIKRRTA
jgi:hypothetical protein